MRFSVPLKPLLLTLVLLTPAAALADLIGSEVTATGYYPNISTPYACCGVPLGPIGPVVVGPGVEFPTASVFFDGQIDITGSQIIWTPTLTEQYSPGAFNGFGLVFSGAPAITGVSVDAASTLPPVSFSFTNNEVFVNLEGEHGVAGEHTILDVQTSASSGPEPASALLSGTALFALGFLIRKRKKTAAR